MGKPSVWKRGGAGIAVAGVLHALLLLAIAGRGVPARAAADDPSHLRAKATARLERSAILRSAESEIAAGRTTLGETIIRLGAIDRIEETGEADEATLDRDRSLAIYRAMRVEVSAAIARGEPIEKAVLQATEKDGRAARYKRMYPRLTDALANGGGNCVALSTLAALLAHDAGRGDVSGFRVYSNHVAPEVAGFHFGMVRRCHGPGEKLATRDLLFAYARARATGDAEPFSFPHTDDDCDDPGDVFGEAQLKRDDPPAMPARPTDPVAVAANALAEKTRVDDTECKRRTVLEEYDEDVEVIGANGHSLGGVGVPRFATLDLAGHAKSASCFDRRVGAMTDSDPDAYVLTLGDAALATEDAARVFAASGELDVAREYERRLAAHRSKAAAPLERVIARLSSDDPAVDTSLVLMNAGRLVALGEGGRTAMMLASERHRGFWEIANLMTRPSSQVGAIKRWGEKPADVQRDVIASLPCASETFRAQLRSVALPEATAIIAACDERVHTIALATSRAKR